MQRWHGSHVFDKVQSKRGFLANAATLTPDANRTYLAFSVGNRVTAKDITMGAGSNQNLDPVQYNLNVIGVNPGNSSTINVIYQLITHTTTAMANLRLKNADWNIVFNKNIQDAYCIQTEIDVTGSCTIGGQVGTISASLQFQGGTCAGGEMQAFYASVGGTGAHTGGEVTVAKIGYSCSGATAKAIIEFGAAAYCTATAGLLLDGEGDVTSAICVKTNGVVTNFAKFNAATANNCIETHDVSGHGKTYAIIIDVAGVKKYLQVYDAT